jgi:hypothetical protein
VVEATAIQITAEPLSAPSVVITDGMIRAKLYLLD